MRWSPYIANNVSFYTKQDSNLYFTCYTDTQSQADNYAWRRWFKISYDTRWVAADRVLYPQPSLPHC